MKLWGGRFKKDSNHLVEDFHSSISFDKRLYKQDIEGSMAHAHMLGEQGIITKEEAEQLIAGLQGILEDIKANKVEFMIGAEDIHMNIETILTERLGNVAKKLHTARSRNDQVALDFKMYLKEEVKDIIDLLLDLEEVLIQLAKDNIHTIMSGYTHLQKAQPITLAHYAMCYAQMFKRDIERLEDCYERMDYCPLGSGALATTTFPIDREMTAKQLGFAHVCANSIDGVSDRDYAIEFAACASMIMMHLSRISEEIIIWSSNEFRYITLDDEYSTGSSIMPQKKNPDMAELVRGKTGRVFGDLQTLLVMMKGIPLAYDKDMQEDKEATFDAVDTVKKALLVFAPMLATMTVNKQRMKDGVKYGFINATDTADYLVGKGVPFRQGHEIVGHLVAYCEENGKALDELTMEEFHQFSDAFDNDVYAAIDVEKCLADRKVYGGPAPEAVKVAIEEMESWVKDQEENKLK